MYSDLVDKIVTMHFDELMTIPEIKKEVGAAYDTIKKILMKERGHFMVVEDVKFERIKREYTKDQITEFHHRELMSLSAIRGKLGCSEKMIERLFQYYEIEIIPNLVNGKRNRIEAYSALLPALDEIIELAKDYRVLLKDISEQFNVTSTILREFLKEHGIVLMSSETGYKLRYELLVSDIDRYAKTHLVSEISDELGILEERVARILREHGHIPNYGHVSLQERLKQQIIEEYNRHIDSDSYTVAEALGISQYTAWKVLSESGAIDKKSDRIWELHGDTILEKYQVNFWAIDYIAKEYNLGEQYVSQKVREHLGVERLPNRSTSQPEEEMAQFIEEMTGLDIKRGDRNELKPYEIDMYIEAKKVGIEFHGLYWHSSATIGHELKHRRKWEMARQAGIHLIQVFDDEWRDKQAIVKRKILHILGKSTEVRMYARKCHVVKLKPKEASSFHMENHIQGRGRGNVHIGLMYDNELVSAMSITGKGGEYKIDRYSTNGIVVGGFSKLLKAFEREYIPTKVETFADLRWSDVDSNVYGVNGFVLDSISPPNYFYTGDFKSRQSRNGFMKHTLPDKFGEVDMTLTEKQIMESQGYHIVYDAGNAKYVKYYN